MKPMVGGILYVFLLAACVAVCCWRDGAGPGRRQREPVEGVDAAVGGREVGVREAAAVQEIERRHELIELEETQQRRRVRGTQEAQTH